MSSFLTVEDVNTAMLNSSIGYHRINLDELPNGVFDWIKTDFAEIKCIRYDDTYIYYFKVHNTNWNGTFSLWTKSGMSQRPATYDYNSFTNILILTGVSHDDFIEFEINPYAEFSFKFNGYNLLTTIYYLTLDEIGKRKTIYVTNGRETLGFDPVFNLGLNKFESMERCFYFIVALVKTDFKFDLNQRLTIGKTNKVRLNVNENYLPNGELIRDAPVNITIQYGAETINAYYDETLNDYCFDLNLTDAEKDNSVTVTVNVDENEYINPTTAEITLKTSYSKVNNFAELLNEILAGTRIIELNNDITFLSRISVTHDLLIYGNNHELNLDGYGFNIWDNNTFKLNDCMVSNGDSSIVQGLQTKVNLDNCTFINCISSNYNNLGSVIYCDVNLESLVEATDFITNITRCTFIDNTCCLFHGGELNITESKLHNTDPEYVDINNPALIYQTDGTCTISLSVFDITYNSDDLCTNEINIGFGQALILCGETALINTYNSEQLSNNDNIPFFEAPYNNQSHVFAKYYYPQLDECVFTSPLKDKEDNSICYAVSGKDWVYKSNVQVTRANNHEENPINPIIWED